MKKKTDLSLMYETMGPFKITLAVSVLFAAVSAVMNIYAYTYIYQAADEIISNIHDTSAVNAGHLKACGKGVLLCICGAFGLYGMSLLFSHITAFNTAARLKNRLIHHIGTLPSGFFDTHSSGGLRKLIEKNTDIPESLIAHQIPNTTQSIVLPLAFAVFMFRYNVAMSIACIIPAIIGFMLLMSIMMGNGGDFVKKYQQASADISNAAVEYVRGIPVMKTFGQTADSFKRYKDATENFIGYSMKFSLSMKTADSSYNTAINSIFFTLVPVSAMLFNKYNDKNIIVCFVFFASLIPMAVTILKRIMSNSSETIIVSEAMETLKKLLAEKPMEYGDKAAPEKYDIHFENVSFRYNDDLSDALNGFEIYIPEGKTAAFVGMSGGGKSTAASLIARYGDVTDGKITIGGTDIRELSHEELNKLISIVFQENTLLKTTIRENITLYRPDASENEIFAALEAAQCVDIISRLPDGIDTVYGADGTYFSGGEIQRLAIARAILKNSPIIILDEATAFADSENEYLIRKALKKLLKDKTVIMIAHRMSTVTDADIICVIENGKITEQGDHSSLISLEGKYAEMITEYNSAVNWKIGAVRQC